MNKAAIDALLAVDVANEQAFLHLTPNENVVSETAKRYSLGNLSGRYHFGPSLPGEKFTAFTFPLDEQGDVYFTALAKDGIHSLVKETERLVNERMGSSNVIFAPLSGLHSMMMSILSTTKVGETVFCLAPVFGGHFVTYSVIESTGRVPKYIPMNEQTLDIDYDAFAEQVAKEEAPYVVYLDVSYSLIPFDIQAIRKAIGKNILVYDASHTMGLMLGGAFPNPLKQGADIITANTHKTLPGSHKGMILFADEELYKTTDARAHAYYSSIHLDHLMTLCITINEMMEFGADYSKKVVDNANLLGDLLTKRGLTCRRGDDKQWTHTHQLHLLTTGLGEPKDLAKRFFDNNMAISFDNRYHQGFFIRFGLQEITRRGADAKEIELLADAIAGAIKGNDVKGLVSSINTALGSSVRYSFDTPTANS